MLSGIHALSSIMWTTVTFEERLRDFEDSRNRERDSKNKNKKVLFMRF